MKPTDTQLIIRKINLIRNDFPRLEDIAKLNFDQYLADIDSQLISERLLERIITRLIDINYHILKTKFNLLPTDYTDSFVKLVKTKTITPEMFQNLSPSAGLRNHLAHEYDDIDPAQVYKGMKNLLKYLPDYLNHLLSQLDLK